MSARRCARNMRAWRRSPTPARAELGYPDTGAMWRSKYDMSPEEFAALTERLWNEVKPLYEEIHCFTRAGLNRNYGDSVQPATGPIRADLLGNLWAQEWGNIYDVVAPRTRGAAPYDLTRAARAGELHARADRPPGRGLLQLAGLRAAAGRPSGSAR